MAGQVRRREMDVIATASAWRVPPDVGPLLEVVAGGVSFTTTPPAVRRRIGRRGARAGGGSNGSAVSAPGREGVVCFLQWAGQASLPSAQAGGRINFPHIG